ncbi:MAG: response regulator [Lachnospiraceae bacterium]|jgi:signal transduction histidine kinase/DNA-binding response OmpR family regulator|uniref:Response regulator n=1 Tax=Hominisplanchenecus murintestinalis TaxID=2941517 RepID=A0AC61R2P9_9FIRM|nr:response regulator [Hominisplanchenecus murintestinalis]MCI9516049.1 response regulator [Lachnospiraceae bacterium]RKK00135.1 response regulator [Anaerotruncus sp. 1XD22-93]MCI9660848.1 response regulator [Lachnospiraceae bacterium]NBH96941.1 response regulator [Lachnospiraceae bacterium]NBI74158.1 response regulator [Lachnospiraceae bacterium]
MKNKGTSLLFSIIIVFSILGGVVFSVSQKISREMSDSAIQNLSESLDLIECTIEAILKNEAEFQKLIAQETANEENPEEYIRSYEKNQTMVKISLIMSGKTEGVSNTGEVFSEGELEFSAGGLEDGVQVSQSYLNYMGAWAYSMKCPVIKDGREIAALYIEYIYDSLDKSLPDGFYNKKAMLYIMDAQTERFVLKPKGMGKRSAGHLNLADFYRANDIQEQGLRTEVEKCLETGKNMLFYHNIRDVKALNYMWSVNGGKIFLIGYVPLEAIQQEGRTVNQNVLVVVSVMLIAFLLCCILYYFNQREQNKSRKEREAEREIHNRQLAEALQAAQIANNSKTMFLSNMSHDIRTPMNAVLGFTTLLAQEAENPAKVREYTKKIMASGQHLLSLINDILDVSKIESGKVVLTYEKFTLNALVLSVDTIIQPMAKAKKQNFYVEVIGVKHEYLLGDEMRMNQILINLLSNAVKYTPEGGNIWFRILGIKQRSSQYERIRIEVQDDGYGMTPEYLETIFDAFTRAENSTTNKVQGTGLGMAITKNIVELMGGTIEVYSEVGKGSLFRVELEFRIPEDQADVQFWKQNGIGRILAVSGEEQICGNIRMLMRDVGVLTDIASDMEEAMQQIRHSSGAEKSYDIILIDWNMPGISALQAAEQVREVLSDEIFILFLTAHDGNEIGEMHLADNTGILAKPFFVSAFREKILEMQTASKEEAGAENGSSLEGMHFLAAEDNEINAEILEELLDMEGADCEIVENGQLAVERFERSAEGEFDAILMDVQMPVMNGHDATKEIRALKRSDATKIPIIAMTANAFAEDEKAALDAGMNAHVAKPLDIDLLKKVIKQYTK